jgi:hypothetical protein
MLGSELNSVTCKETFAKTDLTVMSLTAKDLSSSEKKHMVVAT